MAPTVVVCLDVADLAEPELRREVLKLRRRVQKLTALLRLVLAPLRTSRFRLTEERLPDGRDKIRILRAVDRSRAFVPLRALLRFLHLSGRVEEKRGSVQDRRRQVRAASFVAALAEKSIAPFLLPAHRTGHADFPHPALGRISRQGMR